MEICFANRVVIVDGTFEKSLCRLQAIWRGILTRRRLFEVRQHYEDIFMELEVKPLLHLSWPSTKCLRTPLFSYGFPGEKPSFTSSVETPVKDTNDEDKRAVLCGHCHGRLSEDKPSSCERGICNVKRVEASHQMSNGHDVPQDIHCLSVVIPGESSSGPCEILVATHSRKASGEPAVTCEDFAESEDKSRDVDTSQQLNQATSSPCWSNEQSTDDNTQSRELSAQERDILIAERNSISMELMWIHQAIDSRKQYLRLKTQMVDSN